MKQLNKFLIWFLWNEPYSGDLLNNSFVKIRSPMYKWMFHVCPEIFYINIALIISIILSVFQIYKTVVNACETSTDRDTAAVLSAPRKATHYWWTTTAGTYSLEGDTFPNSEILNYMEVEQKNRKCRVKNDMVCMS